MIIEQIFVSSRIYLKCFRPGKCKLCNKWTWFILRSEDSHEHHCPCSLIEGKS